MAVASFVFAGLSRRLAERLGVRLHSLYVQPTAGDREDKLRHTKLGGLRDERVPQGKWFRDERVPHSHAKPKVPSIPLPQRGCTLQSYHILFEKPKGMPGHQAYCSHRYSPDWGCTWDTELPLKRSVTVPVADCASTFVSRQSFPHRISRRTGLSASSCCSSAQSSYLTSRSM